MARNCWHSYFLYSLPTQIYPDITNYHVNIHTQYKPYGPNTHRRIPWHGYVCTVKLETLARKNFGESSLKSFWGNNFDELSKIVKEALIKHCKFYVKMVLILENLFLLDGKTLAILSWFAKVPTRQSFQFDIFLYTIQFEISAK